MTIVHNPILPGFYPDPSICAVGRDFYLVNSTFAYFPGVPIFHSRDLAHWRQIGNVLTRPSQLPLDGCRHSRGIYAPTLRYYDGTFYLITTNISGGGNFIVTAQDPAGPWSEPYWLGDAAQGIDPSLLFDDDGRCYYVGNRPNPAGEQYGGDWEIWTQELDLTTMRLTGESHALWKGALRDVIWPEGPHLYKKDGMYYLMIAEGGTGPNHSVSVARSKHVFGPYAGNPNNPILTHRHLGAQYPVTCVGHGDLAADAEGNWYMVMLGMRPCGGHTLMGRETFLARVEWQNGWPVVNPGIGKLEETFPVPLPEERTAETPLVYTFPTPELPPEFLTLRGPVPWQADGRLLLPLLPAALHDLHTPAYAALRVCGVDWQAETQLDFTPRTQFETAGLAYVQSSFSHLRIEKVLTDDGFALRLTTRENDKDKILAEQSIPDGPLILRLIAHRLHMAVYYVVGGITACLADAIDLRPYSTESAGGFTGCTVGMYASANGAISDRKASFSWFAMRNL